MKTENIDQAIKDISKMKVSELNDEIIIEKLGQLRSLIEDVMRVTKVFYIRRRIK